MTISPEALEAMHRDGWTPQQVRELIAAHKKLVGALHAWRATQIEERPYDTALRDELLDILGGAS